MTTQYPSIEEIFYVLTIGADCNEPRAIYIRDAYKKTINYFKETVDEPYDHAESMVNQLLWNERDNKGDGDFLFDEQLRKFLCQVIIKKKQEAEATKESIKDNPTPKPTPDPTVTPTPTIKQTATETIATRGELLLKEFYASIPKTPHKVSIESEGTIESEVTIEPAGVSWPTPILDKTREVLGSYYRSDGIDGGGFFDAFCEEFGYEEDEIFIDGLKNDMEYFIECIIDVEIEMLGDLGINKYEERIQKIGQILENIIIDSSSSCSAIPILAISTDSTIKPPLADPTININKELLAASLSSSQSDKIINDNNKIGASTASKQCGIIIDGGNKHDLTLGTTSSSQSEINMNNKEILVVPSSAQSGKTINGNNKQDELIIDDENKIGESTPAKQCGITNNKLGVLTPSTPPIILIPSGPAKSIPIDPTKLISSGPTQLISSGSLKPISTDPVKMISSCSNKILSSDSNKLISPRPTKTISSDSTSTISTDPTKLISSGSTKTISTDPVKTTSSGSTKIISSCLIKLISSVSTKSTSSELLSTDPTKATSITKLITKPTASPTRNPSLESTPDPMIEPTTDPPLGVILKECKNYNIISYCISGGFNVDAGFIEPIDDSSDYDIKPLRSDHKTKAPGLLSGLEDQPVIHKLGDNVIIIRNKLLKIIKDDTIYKLILDEYSINDENMNFEELKKLKKIITICGEYSIDGCLIGGDVEVENLGHNKDKMYNIISSTAGGITIGDVGDGNVEGIKDKIYDNKPAIVDPGGGDYGEYINIYEKQQMDKFFNINNVLNVLFIEPATVSSKAVICPLRSETTTKAPGANTDYQMVLVLNKYNMNAVIIKNSLSEKKEVNINSRFGDKVEDVNGRDIKDKLYNNKPFKDIHINLYNVGHEPRGGKSFGVLSGLLNGLNILLHDKQAGDDPGGGIYGNGNYRRTKLMNNVCNLNVILNVGSIDVSIGLIGRIVNSLRSITHTFSAGVLTKCQMIPSIFNGEAIKEILNLNLNKILIYAINFEYFCFCFT